MLMITLYAKQKKRHRCTEQNFGLSGRRPRVGCFERTALKQIFYQGWNRSPAQAGCMRQVLGAGVLGRPRGTGWRGRWDGGSGWGIHVNPWLIHVSVWQKPLQYCKGISLQLIKINGRKKDNTHLWCHLLVRQKSDGLCWVLCSWSHNPEVLAELTQCLPPSSCGVYVAGKGTPSRARNWALV